MGLSARHLVNIKRAENLIGQTFNRLSVVGFHGIERGFWRWECLCECGKTKIVRANSLKQGKVMSCRCLFMEIVTKEKGQAELNTAYNRYAKRSGNNFEFTKQEFKEFVTQDCHYCGARPVSSGGKFTENGKFPHNGIDRVDNSIGYLKSNCVPCCVMCNFAKRNMGLEVFLRWVKRVHDHLIAARSAA